MKYRTSSQISFSILAVPHTPVYGVAITPYLTLTPYAFALNGYGHFADCLSHGVEVNEVSLSSSANYQQ